MSTGGRGGALVTTASPVAMTSTQSAHIEYDCEDFTDYQPGAQQRMHHLPQNQGISTGFIVYI